MRGKGHVVHKFLETVKAKGVDHALGEVPEEHQILCQALDLDRLPAHLSTEVAYAYNWRTGNARELGRNLGHRNYHLLSEPPTEDEIPCTIDVIGVGEIHLTDGTVVLRGYAADYKTGHTTYPAPNEYGQTMLAALCVRSVLSVDSVTVELIHIHDDGDHHSQRETVDCWDMDIFELEIRDVFEGLPQLEADQQAGRGLAFHGGHHCDYCSAYKHCDAKVAAMRAVPQQLLQLGIRPGAAGELDIEAGAITVRSAAAFYEAAEKIEAILKRGKAEVCSMAFHEPIPLSDGRIIEPRTRTTRVVDGRVAGALLEERYGREEALRRVEVSVTMDQIHAAVVANLDAKAKPRQKISTRKGDGVEDLFLKELERRGGLATNTSQNCRPYKPRGKKALPSAGG